MFSSQEGRREPALPHSSISDPCRDINSGNSIHQTPVCIGKFCRNLSYACPVRLMSPPPQSQVDSQGPVMANVIPGV